MALSQLVGIKDTLTYVTTSQVVTETINTYCLQGLWEKGSLARDQMRPKSYLVNPQLEGPQLPALKMEKQ